MSYYDYNISKVIASHDYPFYAIIMAAMRAADSDNVAALKQVFPRVYRELCLRYEAPGGLLPGEYAPEPTVNLEEVDDYDKEDADLPF